MFSGIKNIVAMLGKAGIRAILAQEKNGQRVL